MGLPPPDLECSPEVAAGLRRRTEEAGFTLGRGERMWEKRVGFERDHPGSLPYPIPEETCIQFDAEIFFLASDGSSSIQVSIMPDSESGRWSISLGPAPGRKEIDGGMHARLVLLYRTAGAEWPEPRRRVPPIEAAR